MAAALCSAPPQELEAAAMAAMQGRWQAVLDELQQKDHDIGRAPLDVRVRAHALEGLAHHMLGDDKNAERRYRQVLASLQRAEKKLERQIGKKDAAVFDARLAAMMESFAEALFFFGERARAKAAAIELAPYQGEPDAAAVKKHFERVVSSWLQRRQRAIARADKSYAQIEALDPAPQAWLCAVASRKAQMLAELRDALRAHTPPASWQAAPAPASTAPPPAAADVGVASEAPPAESSTAAALKQYQMLHALLLASIAHDTDAALEACAASDACKERDGMFVRYCKSGMGKPTSTSPPPKPAWAEPQKAEAPAVDSGESKAAEPSEGGAAELSGAEQAAAEPSGAEQGAAKPGEGKSAE